MTDQTITITQADWNAEMERIHARYQALHDDSLQQAKLRFMDAYDSAVSNVVLVGLCLLILLLLIIIYLALQSVGGGTEMLAPPV